MKIVECAGISLLIILLMSCSGQKDKSTEERVIPVKVVEITGSSLVDGQNYVGTVEEMVCLFPEFSGYGECAGNSCP